MLKKVDGWRRYWRRKRGVDGRGSGWVVEEEEVYIGKEGLFAMSSDDSGRCADRRRRQQVWWMRAKQDSDLKGKQTYLVIAKVVEMKVRWLKLRSWWVTVSQRQVASSEWNEKRSDCSEKQMRMEEVWWSKQLIAVDEWKKRLEVFVWEGLLSGRVWLGWKMQRRRELMARR
jgi:hypothetical protein